MTDEKNPLGLKKIHHVEFYVGNAKQAEFYYRKAFGFSRRGLFGIGNGQPRNDVVCDAAESRQFCFDHAAYRPNITAAEHIKQHGDGVRDIAFQVEDADHAFNEAVEARRDGAYRTARLVRTKTVQCRKAAIHTYGDTIHSFISYNKNNGHNYNGVFSARICRAESRRRRCRHRSG